MLCYSSVQHLVGTYRRTRQDRRQGAIDATDEPIQFERILAIRKVFEAAEEPVSDTLITAAVNEADKLHPLHEKASKMEQEAEQTSTVSTIRPSSRKAAAAKEEEAAYLKHHDHIYGQMAAPKLPSIFSNPEVAEEIKSARPATDPADKAFQARRCRASHHRQRTLRRP